MAPVKFKEILKVSSEDIRFPATNLLQGCKWMSDIQDQSGEAFIELSLDEPLQIHFVDLGYVNVALMEIHVALSTWPAYRDYAVLLSKTMLQNSMDARTGKNKVGCKMFNFTDHLNMEVGSKAWDKVKLVLSQPYARNKQMGIEFIRLGTGRSDSVETPTKSLQPNSHPSHKFSENIKSSPNMTSPSSQFESKLRKMSNLSGSFQEDNKGLLGRTAKMVMASKMKQKTAPVSPTITDHTDDLPHIQTTKNKNTRKSLYCQKETTQHLQSKQVKRLSASGSKKEAYSPHSSHKESSKFIDTKSYEKENINVKVQLKQEAVEGANSMKKDSPVRKKVFPEQSQKLPLNSTDPATPCQAERTNFRVQNKSFPVKTNSESQKTTSSVNRNTSNNVEESTETKEPVYTDAQIKQLKKAIKRFFNMLDMESFDPNKQTVRDLRKKFESGHNVKLNKDGRGYFREVTARYMEIILTKQNHKSGQNETANASNQKGVKRKSSEIGNMSSLPECSMESPAKLCKQSSKYTMQCPLCFEYFDKSVINAHAQFCGGPEETNSSIRQGDSLIEVGEIAPRSVVDCSENSCLSKEEQQMWIRYSSEPKPYQERLNRSDYEGSLLVKCPSCGQKYKSTEIAMHSDDCAEKVYSGCTRMGLYLVENKKTKKQKQSAREQEKTTNHTIVLD